MKGVLTEGPSELVRIMESSNYRGSNYGGPTVHIYRVVKKKGPLFKNCRTPSKITQIKLDLVVLFSTYIGIIM